MSVVRWSHTFGSRYNRIPLRFVLYSRQRPSGKVRYLRYAYGQVFLPDPVPIQSRYLTDSAYPRHLLTHPAYWLNILCRQMGIPAGRLEVVTGFRRWFEISGTQVPVYLVRVKGTTPFTIPWGATWVEGSETRLSGPLEAELLNDLQSFLMACS